MIYCSRDENLQTDPRLRRDSKARQYNGGNIEDCRCILRSRFNR